MLGNSWKKGLLRVVFIDCLRIVCTKLVYMFLLPEMETQTSSPQSIGATMSLFRLQILAVEFLDTGSKFVCHVGLILDPPLFPFPFPSSAV
jgi:hypothetical protein